MAAIKPKQTIQKTYRLDQRMADAMEKLAKRVGRTQNELFVIALEDFLLMNRQYFLDDWAMNTGIKKAKEAIFGKHEGITVRNGLVTLDVVRLEENQFDYEISVYNRYDELQDQKKGELEVSDRNGWEKVFGKYLEWVQEYTDIDDAEVINYFKEMFSCR